MKTLGEFFKRDSAYWGESSEWLVARATTRDASTLDRSNWKCFLQLLGGTGAEGANGSQGVVDGVRIEEASHWACGWIQYLIIDPSRKDLVAIAESTIEKLEGYPVLNEEDWSALEDEEAQQVWRDCYRPKERVNYVREHRNQFEFQSLADMIGCIRGKYFCGYASELVS